MSGRKPHDGRLDCSLVSDFNCRIVRGNNDIKTNLGKGVCGEGSLYNQHKLMQAGLASLKIVFSKFGWKELA